MSNPRGIVGFNVRVNGVSRDQIIAAQQQIQGAFMLVQDNAELVPIARAAGCRVIYRQSGDEDILNHDTDAALKQAAFSFVDERAAKGADYVHLSNEVVSSPKLHQWTRYALEHCISIGVKAVCYQYGTNADKWQYDAAADNIRFAIAHDMAVGVHVYLDATHDSGAYAWLELKHQLGGLWCCTEFGYIKSIFDRDHGYRGVLSPAQYSSFLDATLSQFQRENMPILLFSGDNWPANAQGKASGFGVLDNAELVQKMHELNTKYVWSGTVTQPVITIPPILGEGLPATVSASAGLRQHSAPSVNAPTLRTLPYRAALTEYPSTLIQEGINPFVYVVDSAGNNGWVSNVYLAPVEAKPTFTFHAPFAQYKIVSRFNDPRPGYVKDYPGKLAKHEGCDFEPTDGVSCDAVVHIGAACTVTQVGDQSPVGYGKFILVDFGNGFTMILAHFAEIYVKAGQTLIDGQIVGLMGQTGSASEPHVHVSLSNPAIGLDGYVYPKVVDPELYLVKS